ncbi:MAG: hypothetical protein Q8N22_02960 [bacterium]|nr:hypothetical protein [bacterium]
MTNFKQELMKKLSFVLLILIIPVTGLVFLGTDIGHRAETTKTQRQSLADHSESLSLYAKLQSQSVEAEPYISVLQNVLPIRDRLLDFQKEMERLATQSGVGFGFNFMAETPSTATAAGRMGFTMVSQGSISKIFNFIKLMENSRFLVSFSNFDFTGSTANINGEVLFH